jgi:hypothetical protein
MQKNQALHNHTLEGAYFWWHSFFIQNHVDVRLIERTVYSFGRKNAGKMQETCRVLGLRPQFMDITLLKSVINWYYLRLNGTKGDSAARTLTLLVSVRIASGIPKNRIPFFVERDSFILQKTIAFCSYLLIWVV